MEMDPILRAVAEQVSGAGRSGSSEKRTAKPSRPSGTDLAERDLLRLLVRNEDPDLDRVTADLFLHPGRRQAAEWLLGPGAAAQRGTQPDLASMPAGEMADQLRRLALVNDPLPPADDVVARLERRGLDLRIAELRRVVEGPDADTESETYSIAFKELQALQVEKRR